jgi:hypothetical protein
MFVVLLFYNTIVLKVHAPTKDKTDDEVTASLRNVYSITSLSNTRNFYEGGSIVG